MQPAPKRGREETFESQLGREKTDTSVSHFQNIAAFTGRWLAWALRDSSVEAQLAVKNSFIRAFDRAGVFQAAAPEGPLEDVVSKDGQKIE